MKGAREIQPMQQLMGLGREKAILLRGGFQKDAQWKTVATFRRKAIGPNRPLNKDHNGVLQHSESRRSLILPHFECSEVG